MRSKEIPNIANADMARHIYITDVVEMDISASNIRSRIREADDSWRTDVPAEVAKYIEKYQIYN
jgi:nicotinic acid mononucleotide adenylyltransferase